MGNVQESKEQVGSALEGFSWWPNMNVSFFFASVFQTLL
jgi:hypothetical protein